MNSRASVAMPKILHLLIVYRSNVIIELLKMSVEQMLVEQMQVEQMAVEQMLVEQMYVEQMPVEQMYAQQMLVEQMPVEQMLVEHMWVEQKRHCEKCFLPFHCYRWRYVRKFKCPNSLKVFTMCSKH